MMRRAIFFPVLLGLATNAMADETLIGTWTLDGQRCKGGIFHWVIEADKASNEAFTCLNATYVQTEPGRWVGHMTHCHSDDSHFATDERFVIHGDQMEWQDRKLHRCLFNID